MRCPVCKGKGDLPEPRSAGRDKKAERRRMVRVLRENGYSIRQIADLIGYKSPRSVVLALNGK